MNIEPMINGQSDKSLECKVCLNTQGYTRIYSNLDKCEACGFVTYLNFSQSALSDIYDDEYFSGSEYPDYLGQQAALRRSMQRHLAQMKRYMPLAGNLLEIGSAYGLFLDEARRYFKSVRGVDICEGPTSYSRNTLNLDVQCADFLSVDFGQETFQAVCMWDTVEHLAAPEAYIERAFELLSDDGMLFLTTGDIGSLNARFRGAGWRQIHPPSHLHYFSKETISRLLQRIGFKVEAIETASYYHTVYNVLASISMREGLGGKVASTALNTIGEQLSNRLGLWIDLGDIMFVAARRKG
jgi:hypothetical protein